MSVLANLPSPPGDPEWPLVDASMAEDRLSGYARISQRNSAYDEEAVEVERVPPRTRGQGKFPDNGPLWVKKPSQPIPHLYLHLFPHGMAYYWQGRADDVMARWVEVMREWGAGSPGTPTYYEVPAVVLFPAGNAWQEVVRPTDVARTSRNHVRGNPKVPKTVFRTWLTLDLEADIVCLGWWKFPLPAKGERRGKVIECRRAHPKAKGEEV